MLDLAVDWRALDLMGYDDPWYETCIGCGHHASSHMFSVPHECQLHHCGCSRFTRKSSRKQILNDLAAIEVELR